MEDKATVTGSPVEAILNGAPSAGHARSPRRLHFGRAAVIGLGAGLLAVAFRRALGAAESGRGDLLNLLHAHALWGWIVLPVIGLVAGCLVGWMTQRFAPEAAGSGIPHLKGVLLHVRKLSWTRLIPVKFLGGVMGIGAGLSLGREGPTVQMGAAVARALVGPLRAPDSDIPQLLSAGAGAGLAAAFNAPLAGLLFVIEELHRELSSRTAAGALVAAVCATVVTQWLAGDTPSFEVHGLTAMPLWALPLAAVIGAVGGAGGVLFNKALLAGQAAALSQRRLPRWALPGVAGVLVGVAAWWLPDAVGGGQGVAERVLGGTMGATLLSLAMLIVVKFVLTAASYASGAAGGIFAPMLLLGRSSGRAGEDGQPLSPSPGLAGAGAGGAGDGGVLRRLSAGPLTGIVLISEMTGGYELLFPICIAASPRTSWRRRCAMRRSTTPSWRRTSEGAAWARARRAAPRLHRHPIGAADGRAEDPGGGAPQGLPGGRRRAAAETHSSPPPTRSCCPATTSRSSPRGTRPSAPGDCPAVHGDVRRWARDD